MFFDVEVFKTFVKDCRKWGINCPVVPGLMCINAYAGFVKMTKFCKTRVPKELQESNKDITLCINMMHINEMAFVCGSA